MPVRSLGISWVLLLLLALPVRAIGAGDVHAELFERTPYPSASACRTCHEAQYREWSVSPHAYAQLSPVFNSMHGTILKRTNGTFGDFCIRCHTPVGMALEEPLFTSNLERNPVSVEGVTCVVCHRVDRPYGKVTGRRGLVAGDIHQPVYGPTGGEELERVLAEADRYGVVSEPDRPGRRIHAEVHKLPQITTSGFCASCHDVTFVNGFRLEEAFSEYKLSPAARRGESCQDCHMGRQPGVAEGYDEGPAAVVGGEPTRVRRRSNHMIAGPDHPIVHLGLFPHNPAASELASPAEWLAFDVDAGWGIDAFEDRVDPDAVFPERWASADDRYEGRELLDEQQALRDEAFERGTQLLRAGYRLGDVEVERADSDGLRFHVDVHNGTDGHNVPTGFIGERVVFLQVTVSDAEGAVVFRSGDLDPNGDVRDLHSVYVHDGELPLDTQLFSLQSRFLTRMVRGGEREQVLSVNYSADPLPFARPNTRPSILTGRTEGARIHRKGIEPRGRRTATYRVSAQELTGAPPYSAQIRLVAGMVPPNLIHEISEVGFDYGMTAREVADAVVAGHRVLWERVVLLESD